MPRISLILPLSPESTLRPEQVAPFQQALEGAGYEVEVIAASGSATGSATGSEVSWRLVPAETAGRTAAVVAGLREARGDVLLVLDLERGYAPEDLAHVVAPLVEDAAELAVASRWPGAGAGGRVRGLVRTAVGTADLTSGLIGLTRGAFLRMRETLVPSGRMFTFELLARARGRCVEVAAAPRVSAWRQRPGVDDFRQWKRLADHRFGNLSRLIQFCVVGASGMVVDLTGYAAFQWLFARTWLADRTAPGIGGSLDLAAAGVLAIALALCWNFTLNRRLTFSYARQGSLIRQFVTYALSNALGISLSLGLRLTLPRSLDFFDRHKLAAAVVGIVAATGVSFTMSRWLVFRRQPTPAGPQVLRPFSRTSEGVTAAGR